VYLVSVTNQDPADNRAHRLGGRVARGASSRPVRGAGEEKHRSLTEVAYQAIKHRVITLDLAPGELFNESQLAGELQFSKTPVREALSRLRREGLVEVVPRHGYRATGITLQQIQDLLAVRLLLEVEACGLAAQRPPAGGELELLEEASKASYDSRDKESITRFLISNRTLHGTIARLSGNEQLERMYLETLDQMDRVFHLGMLLSSRADDVGDQHADLVAAISSGNVEEARRIGAEHVHLAKEMLMEAALSSPAIMTTDITIPRR
jgi:DNA-binding GntR family transcriptional regulator